MAEPVPATAISRFHSAYEGSVLYVGGNTIKIGVPLVEAYYWYVVVDLANDLAVVANVASKKNDSVPSEIASLAANPDYFLFFIANSQFGYNVPHGDLYAFLQKAGSGSQLARAEQMIEQAGTGTIRYFSYALGVTMDQNDLSGFEQFSVNNASILTMRFTPVDINGKVRYVPTA